MAGEKVMSGNLRLKLDSKTIYHAIGCTLSMNRNFKERATKDTTGTERSKGTKDWNCSFNGLAVYDSDGTGTHDFFALFDLYDSESSTPIDIEFTPSEGDATYYLAGEGFLESLERDAQNDEDATVSGSIVGNGALTKTTI